MPSQNQGNMPWPSKGKASKTKGKGDVSSVSRFPASRVIFWARSGSGPVSPGRFFPEPEGPVPTLVTGMSSSPPAGVEPGSMTIGL
ncbi:unnamed protein product [Brassica oleracea var. botrytis]|uniref:(rape) hypothetical protein n=1 Tax=Brassica napus TaxID=3708 RepID=A0A816ITG2_BRANA|nr:unnamed protein product [Brassica napus]